jgi:hypothetical protein
MLTLLRWTFLFCVLAFFSYVAGQEIGAAYYYKYANNELQTLFFRLVADDFDSIFIWIGNHLDLISALVTAAATVVIALYTFALSASTKALREAANQQKIDTQKALEIATRNAEAATSGAEAAMKSANTYIAGERGVLFVNSVSLTRNAPMDPTPVFHYSFINAGRTPLTLKEAVFNCDLVGANLPTTPVYDITKGGPAFNALMAGAVIGTDTPIALPRFGLPAPLSPADYQDLIATRKHVLFKGYVRYRGLFNDSWKRKFAMTWIPGTDNFQDVATPPGYNEEEDQ